MVLDDEICYRALAARDRRFDGAFFVGVTSTGVFCRPICPARTPRPERCAFFADAAGALAAGFRPCKRCRPDSAQGRGDTESLARLARAALLAIDEGALDQQGLEALAARLTVSARHLRRALREVVGLSPLAIAQERRLALARALIEGTSLPLVQVSLCAGYQSLRRFNEAFRDSFGLAPSRWRRDGASASSTGLHLRLPVAPPFDGAGVLATLAAGNEGRVDEGRWRRRIVCGAHEGELAVTVETAADGRPLLALSVATSLLPALRLVVAKVSALFDLHARPAVIDGHLSRDPALAPLVAARPGLRLVGTWDAPSPPDPDAFEPGPMLTAENAARLGVRDEAAALARADGWRPWRAYALAHLRRGRAS